MELILGLQHIGETTGHGNGRRHVPKRRIQHLRCRRAPPYHPVRHLPSPKSWAPPRCAPTGPFAQATYPASAPTQPPQQDQVGPPPPGPRDHRRLGVAADPERVGYDTPLLTAVDDRRADVPSPYGNTMILLTSRSPEANRAKAPGAPSSPTRSSIRYCRPSGRDATHSAVSRNSSDRYVNDPTIDRSNVLTSKAA